MAGAFTWRFDVTSGAFNPEMSQEALALFQRTGDAAGLDMWNETLDRIPGESRRFGFDLGTFKSSILRPLPILDTTTRSVTVVVEPLPLQLYFEVIEFGRRPGTKVPITKVDGKRRALPLEPWVRRKLAYVEIAKALGYKRKRGTRVTDDAIELGIQRAALAIAIRIGKRGFAPPYTEGLHAFDRAFEASVPKVEKRGEQLAADYIALMEAA